MKEEHVFYSEVHPDEGQPKFILRGLDGLRAIAVLLVLVYHLWPLALPGGMIGVDIFFVISGYLITALLIREGAYQGKVNLPAFWVRRLRRLIPAVFVLVTVVGSCALLIGGDVQVGLGRQILGAFTYSSNWLYIAQGHDYFTQTSPELLTNFWSLAVEEQFYLFWPIIFVFACMFLTTWFKRSLIPAGLGLFSLALSAILVLFQVGINRIYYGTDTHLYGLMLGVSLALVLPWSMYPPQDSRLYNYVGYGKGQLGLIRALAGWVCLIGLFPLAKTLHSDSAFFMPWGLFVAALLALGIIQSLFADVRNPAAELLRTVLSFPPLVWLGRRSYGIYLWHWPLYVLAHYLLGPNAGLLRNWVILFLSLGIAGLSYMFVEEPIRRFGFRATLASWYQGLTRGKSLPARITTGLLVLGVISTVFAVATAPRMTTAQQLVAAGAGGQNSIKIAPTAPATSSAATPAATAHPSTAQLSAGQPAATPATSAQLSSAPVATTSGSFNEPVTIVGDSVTVASSAELQQDIPQASIDAAVSRTIVQATPILEQLKSSGQMSNYVVIAIATNSTTSQAQLSQLVDTLSDGNRKFIFVTGIAPANLTWVAGTNAAIYGLAQQYPGKVFVADWAKTGAGHPEWLASDGVHPQAAGQAVYAKTIADALTAAKNSK